MITITILVQPLDTCVCVCGCICLIVYDRGNRDLNRDRATGQEMQMQTKQTHT